MSMGLTPAGDCAIHYVAAYDPDTQQFRWTMAGKKRDVTASGEREAPPLYEMVVRTLRSEIATGIFPVGMQLPSEGSLVTRFGVSRHTIREALRRLRADGLIETHQGTGTTVLRHGGPQRYVHEVNSISDLFDFNVETKYGEDDTGFAHLPTDLCAELDVEPKASWLKVNGSRSMAGAPPLCEVEVFVASRFAGVARLLGRRSGPIYALIEAVYGESIGEVQQSLRTFVADYAQGRQLGLEPGDVGMEIRRIYRLNSGEIAQISFNRYRSADFSFNMTLRKVRN